LSKFSIYILQHKKLAGGNAGAIAVVAELLTLRLRFGCAEVMDDVAQTIPTLDKIVSEIEGLAESGGKYAEAPHVIEVTLPMLCRSDKCC
jgi:hypothetical protein